MRRKRIRCVVSDLCFNLMIEDRCLIRIMRRKGIRRVVIDFCIMIKGT